MTVPAGHRQRQVQAVVTGSQLLGGAWYSSIETEREAEGSRQTCDAVEGRASTGGALSVGGEHVCTRRASNVTLERVRRCCGGSGV